MATEYKRNDKTGVDLFIEVGPGSTLTNLIRKIDPGVEVLNIQAVGV